MTPPTPPHTPDLPGDARDDIEPRAQARGSQSPLSDFPHDELDTLLRAWHTDTTARAAAGKDRLLAALASDVQSNPTDDAPQIEPLAQARGEPRPTIVIRSWRHYSTAIAAFLALAVMIPAVLLNSRESSSSHQLAFEDPSVQSGLDTMRDRAAASAREQLLRAKLDPTLYAMIRPTMQYASITPPPAAAIDGKLALVEPRAAGPASAPASAPAPPPADAQHAGASLRQEPAAAAPTPSPASASGGAKAERDARGKNDQGEDKAKDKPVSRQLVYAEHERTDNREAALNPLSTTNTAAPLNPLKDAYAFNLDDQRRGSILVLVAVQLTGTLPTPDSLALLMTSGLRPLHTDTNTDAASDTIASAGSPAPVTSSTTDTKPAAPAASSPALAAAPASSPAKPAAETKQPPAREALAKIAAKSVDIPSKKADAPAQPTIVTGYITLDQLEALALLPNVVKIEAVSEPPLPATPMP